MTDSILNTIKKMLGIVLDDTAFDTDIIVLINAAIAILRQVGVGPENPILVVDKDTLWSSFTVDQTILSLSQQFIYLSVKMSFDAPGTSYHLTATKDLMDQMLWRAREEADPYVLEDEEENQP